jgi:hypothetical protein
MPRAKLHCFMNQNRMAHIVGQYTYYTAILLTCPTQISITRHSRSTDSIITRFHFHTAPELLNVTVNVPRLIAPRLDLSLRDGNRKVVLPQDQLHDVGTQGHPRLDQDELSIIGRLQHLRFVPPEPKADALTDDPIDVVNVDFLLRSRKQHSTTSTTSNTNTTSSTSSN